MISTFADSSMYTTDVHCKHGSFAVCFERIETSIRNSNRPMLSKVFTVAKLAKGAPQLRYVNPEYPGKLVGPNKVSPIVREVISTAIDSVAGKFDIAINVDGVRIYV